MVRLTSEFAAGLSRRRGKGELESAFGVGAGSQLPKLLGPLSYLFCGQFYSWPLLFGETAIWQFVSVLAETVS